MALKFILELEFETRNSTLSDWNSNTILLEAFIEIESEHQEYKDTLSQPTVL